MKNMPKKTSFQRYVLRYISLPVAFACGLVIPNTLFGQISLADPDTTSIVQETAESITELDKAIEANQMLIENYPNSDFTPSVMYQLMELHYRKTTAIYQHEMAKYEEDLVEHERGLRPKEPTLPTVSYSETIQNGENLLVQFPTASFLDRILYRIAICYIDEGNKSNSKEYLARLISEFPESEYRDEARFRLGEIAFETQDYQTSAAIYAELLKSYDGQFFNMALYKLGWSYYNINQFEKAISTFIFLVDDLDRAKEMNQDSLAGNAADLREEAIQYVAECFTEIGGARTAQRFLRDMGEKEYSQAIFIALGEIYEDRDDFVGANETYMTMLEMWPWAHRAPETADRIIQNYIRLENNDKAEDARDRLVANYGPGSEWTTKHASGEFYDKAMELVEKHLYTLATDAQASGRDNKSERDLQIALARYTVYLEKFPRHLNAAKVQYYQAECFYELNDYIGASQAYEKVIVNYPYSEFASKAAYNRVIASMNTLESGSKLASNTDSTTFYLDDFLGSGNAEVIKVPNEYYNDLLRSCNDYARYLPKDEKLPEVMMKFGEVLFNLDYYQMAAQAYTRVINRGKDSPFSVKAMSMIAQSYYKNEDFMKAEGWYRRLEREFPDSTKYVEKAKNMIASSKFKIAEKLKEEGNTELASRALAVIASTSDNQEIAERALIQSATGYEESGKIKKAITILENLRFRFPESEQVDEALYKAATLAEQIPDYNRAANDYLELVRSRPNSQYVADALYSAATCFENMKQMDKAAGVFERYATEHKDEPDKMLHAWCTVGAAAIEWKDIKKAKSAFERVLRIYNEQMRAGGMVDDYYGAQAHFMLGEIYFDHYMNIRLEPPLDKAIQRKQSTLKAVAKSYSAAVKMQIADWKTAALHKLGVTFEEYGRFLWESERPAGLDATQLASYEANLKQQVEPYQTQALDYYRTNVNLGQEAGLENDWIKKSKLRMTALEVKLGIQPPSSAQSNSSTQTSNGYANKSQMTNE